MPEVGNLEWLAMDVRTAPQPPQLWPISVAIISSRPASRNARASAPLTRPSYTPLLHAPLARPRADQEPGQGRKGRNGDNSCCNRYYSAARRLPWMRLWKPCWSTSGPAALRSVSVASEHCASTSSGSLGMLELRLAWSGVEAPCSHLIPVSTKGSSVEGATRVSCCSQR